MGVTDRMDQNLNAYRCSICSKKWWWPLFVFGLESAIQNAWHIYRLWPSFSSKPLHLLNFRREICLTYFQQSMSNLPGPGRPITKTRKRKVLDTVRYDGLNHFIEVNKTQIRCGNCGKKVTRKCNICNIGLREKRFKDFHTK